MTNPSTNFFKDTSVMTDEQKAQYESDMSFHLATWTIDTVTDFPDINEEDSVGISTQQTYKDAVAAMIDTIKSEVERTSNMPDEGV